MTFLPYLCIRFPHVSQRGTPRENTSVGFRDVAQLVAHYVRDVGVGRSSRLIPTAKKEEEQQLVALLYLERMVLGQRPPHPDKSDKRFFRLLLFLL